MLEKERDEYLIEIYELLKENNKLLKRTRRSQILSRIFKLIWIFIIFGLPFLFYIYYIKPLLQGLSNNVAQLEGISRVNPAIGAQIEPVIQTIKTMMNLLGI